MNLLIKWLFAMFILYGVLTVVLYQFYGIDLSPFNRAILPWIGGVISVILVGAWIREKLDQTAPGREAKRESREEEFRNKAEKLRKEKELTAELSKKQREEEYAGRLQLRAEIEKMPKYLNWRKAVFEKFGTVCEICGESVRLEIHHRISFDSILRKHRINTITEAFSCDEIWDINNGSVLCKKCHDKMDSSIMFRKLNP